MDIRGPLRSNDAYRFPSTRWSVVIAATGTASPETDFALETICREYWYPLYVFARQSGRSPEDAEDLTQGFFGRLLEEKWLQKVDRSKGRLRTFLITAFKHFMANEWRRSNTARRGGRIAHSRIDTRFAESRFAAEPSSSVSSADVSYERQWALTLLELTFSRLQLEYEEAGKARDYKVLKPCLMAERGRICYEEIGVRLGLREGAARVAVHRFRKRFREIYREEVSRTLSQHENPDEELRHLAKALAAG